MGTYAKGTAVPVERSKGEVERILARFGARRTMVYNDEAQVVLVFEAGTVGKAGARRFKIGFPKPAHRNYPGVRAYAQAERERWREIVAYLKATLIAVEAGFVTLEAAFLANVLLPSGATVGEWMEEQLDETVRSGAMPPMLPWAKGSGGSAQVIALPAPRVADAD